MSRYEPAAIEKRWQEMWKREKIYHFDPNSDKIYSIDNPPRYASGALHLGHATGYSLIDFVARYKRMRGYNVFFPLCFDVNGTPIEIMVERKYNINKLNTSREKYRELCEKFANEKITQMIHEFEMLGESMDPSIYYQTDMPYYRRITQLSFIELFNKGLVYKGNYPVNWCPSCMTALADAEVEYKNNINKLNYIKFQIADENPENFILIATTRPELLCTCKAVAVHPDDKEKRHLIGKELITPLFKKRVKVISDPKVKMKYGTGNVMICTIGDKDDLEWTMKYHFDLERGIDEQGKMTELAGKYAGMTVLEAREASINDLKNHGILVKQEENRQQVSICWRCHTPIEYLQVPQWFLKTLDFKKQILEMAKKIRWFPQFMKIRLDNWTNSLQWDWVLGRQRIFATPVPIWECNKCGHAVCATKEMCYCDPIKDDPPVDKCSKCGCTEFSGCTDVFDTWMDSSGSALYNTYWGRDEELHKKLWPMSLRPQSHDIIRTWAFYTMLRSNQIKEDIPWKDIMIHGFIMAPDGTPMHTSTGNVIDPIPILKKYGADAFRYYASTCSLGIDHAFREKDVVRGSKICNKVFNIGQFVGPLFDTRPIDVSIDELRLSDKWIISKYSRIIESVTEYMDDYAFDKAMRDIENFIWHEFADHYIEMVKFRRDSAVKYTLYNVFLGSIKMLTPFMPHVTEDIYQEHFVKYENIKSIHLTEWPKHMFIDEKSEKVGELLKEIIASIRKWKSEMKIPLNSVLQSVELIGPSIKELNEVLLDITNTVKIKKLQIVEKGDIVEKYTAVKPLYSNLGPVFKTDVKSIIAEIINLDPEEVASALANEGKIVISVNNKDIELTSEYLAFEKKTMLNGNAVDILRVNDVIIAIKK